ncbi:MAG: HIRAN domain-containing protein [Xanthomarina gelatinilytica]|uniref:HIRAN domain-containing protein n=1 Tax=Xanthomarina gelatinilytica TaxID=1137281 RepID=UPI003A860FF0
MNRSDFVKSLGLGAGGLILPQTLFVQKSVLIYDNYLSGLTYYDYEKTKQHLKEGQQLKLVREAENIHDAFAVQVFFENHKIGYLQAFENISIAYMLGAGAELKAETSYHNPNAGHYKNHTLAIAIYAELISVTPKLLTKLQNIRADNAFDRYRKHL